MAKEESYKEDKVDLTEGLITEKEALAEQKKVDKMDSKKMVGIMDEVYAKAIDGIPKISRSVDSIASEYMARYKDAKTAAKELAKYQIAKCGTTGFITGLGGIITLPVAIPANVGRVMYVQLRMVAAIAQMGGFDIHSDQVQTVAYACLTGNALTDVIKQTGIRMGEKISESVITRIPAKILTIVNQKVGFKMIAQFGTEGAINLMEFVPVAGGLVGGAIDVASTRIIANNAISIFIDKKMPEEKKSFKEAALPVAKKGAETLGKAKNYVGEGINNVSHTVKTKYDETVTEIISGMDRVKMTVKQTAVGTINEGKLCHVINSPRRILLSWDYFTDEFGNKYEIENAVSMPAKQKKSGYEYRVDFKDQSIELPKGTVLFAGEDKWRKKLPKCDIDGISYYAGKIAAENAESASLSPEAADIAINLSEDGLLKIDRKNSTSTPMKFKLGKRIAKKVFDDLRDCISSGESRPFDSDDTLVRVLTIHFENGKEVTYKEIRGLESGVTTRDIIHDLVKSKGLNCVV